MSIIIPRHHILARSRMQPSRHYPHPPIVEAIIDLRFDVPNSVTLDELKACQIGEEGKYPLTESLFTVAGSMTFVNGQTTTATQHQQLGYRFATEDGKNIWQARKDGFAFSRLAPYESWEPFESEAKRLWETVRSKLSPTAMTRLSVRNINRIDIPSERIDLKDFFCIRPEVAEKLPYDVAKFFMQVYLALPALKGYATINQTIVPSNKEGTQSFILDIEVIREIEVPQTDCEIWKFFGDLRTCKNELFEASITDNARRLFE